MISDTRLEQAMTYLATTDIEFAGRKANVERCEILRKRIRSREFLTSDGTVAERQAMSETSESTGQADDSYIHALQSYEEMKAKRQTEALVVDVWRSIQANRRAGS